MANPTRGPDATFSVPMRIRRVTRSLLRRPCALLTLASVLLVPLGCAAEEPAPPPVAADPRLDALGGASRSEAQAAIDEIVEERDLRFAAAFVELLRAAKMGLASPAVGAASADALEALSGKSFGQDWGAWVRWYAGTDLTPPPGFTSWKGRLLAQIDPVFGELLRDEHPSRIRVEEVVWGGVPYEGIPALDRPDAVPAAEAGYLEPDDPVFGLFLGGEARAYPLRLLDWHEMANDVLGGVPFSLAYCTLCGSGIAYDTRVPDHPDLAGLDFGSSGFLMRSNKLMVDRQTETLWNQFTGEPVLGKLASRDDLRLPVLPSVVTTWQAWRERHPETTVLSLQTGHRRDYGPGAAYAGYFASPGTMFPVRRARTELPEKERVFGLRSRGASRAYPLALVVERGVVNDDFAGESVVLVASGDRIQVDGVSVRSGPARYDAGGTVRAYARGEHRFQRDDTGRLVDEQGRPWSVSEERLRGPEGETLVRRPGVLAYWFGWSGFHPDTELYAAAP